MIPSKRPAPFGNVQAFGFKQARTDHDAAAREYHEPRIVDSVPAEPKPSTDFTTWTEPAIKDFLDQRGVDHDDCVDFYALAQRAFEAEQQAPAAQPAGAADDEDDPLEAFMADIDQTLARESAAPAPAKPAAATRDSCDDEDAMAEYMEAHAARKAGISAQAAPDYSGYGSDEEVYAVAQALDTDADRDEAPLRQGVDPLPPVQHELMNYPKFEKNLYDENPEIFAMDEDEVQQRRAQLEVTVSGQDVPRPVASFEHCGFDDKLAESIRKAGYKQPTAIQAQALPVVLSGRDVLGIAKTGSGKTAAFVLPMVVHISAQPRVSEGQGPVAVLLAPTRELAEQIHQQCRQFTKAHGHRCCAAFGGLAKYSQMKELRGGVEVAVATPGRLIDLVKSRACDFLRTTYLVIDEADRCFDLGFEPQVFSIVRHIRPDRQTLLFSATMPRKVQHLADEALTNAVRITVGSPGGANLDVRQTVLVMATHEQKLQWLRANVQSFVDDGDVLVFCNQKKTVDEIVVFLKALSIKAEGMHGDLDQHTRMAILNGFKAGKSHALVATDVAARGLDIRSIKTVVSFDAAKEADTHVHRIGRTGRAGDKDGTAYTLLMPRETRMAASLVKMLQEAGLEVPKNVNDVAMKDHGFRKGAGAYGGKGKAVGGRGLGFGSTAPEPGSHAQTHRDAPAFQPAAARPAAAAPAPAQRTPTSFQPAATRVATSAPAAAPRGFVASNQVAGGDLKSHATIVMPVRAEAAAARDERPAEWLQKRLQQGGGRFGASGSATRGAMPVGPSGPAMDLNDAVARAVETARQAAARARDEAANVRAESAARLGMNRGPEASASQMHDAGLPPPPAHGSMHAVPPPSFGYSADASQRMPDAHRAAPRAPPLSAEEARAVAMAAAARIASGGGQPPPPQAAPGAAGVVPPPPSKAPLSAEDARAVVMAAAARIVAQSGGASASGQTSDGKQWAWGQQ